MSMLESLRSKIVAVSLVILFILGSLGFWFFVLNKKKQPAVVTDIPESTVNVDETKTPDVYVPEVLTVETEPAPMTSTQPSEEAHKRYVIQVARTFVERFETSSNQNDNSNIEDVSSLITSRMALWVASQWAAQSPSYEGVTARVIESKMKSYAPPNAEVSIGVQEELVTAAGLQQVAYKNGTVRLVQILGDWKVDGLFWEQ